MSAAVALLALVEAEVGLRVPPAKLQAALEDVPDVDELLGRLRAREQAAWDQLLPRLTVGETYFQREPRQLERFRREALPGLAGRAVARGLGLRLLSAGCSTGEEAYTLAIMAAEAGMGAETWGMDVDRRALAVAEAGEYGPNAFRGTAESWRGRHFEPAGPGRWRVRAEHRGRLRWRRGNLVKLGFPEPWGRFDAIFCRNVLIYFDRATQAAVVMQLRRLLQPGGLLFFGHAEILLDRMGDLGLAFCEASGAYRRREDR